MPALLAPAHRVPFRQRLRCPLRRHRRPNRKIRCSRFPTRFCARSSSCLPASASGWWHPAWVIFLTIPFYYWVVNTLEADRLTKLGWPNARMSRRKAIPPPKGVPDEAGAEYLCEDRAHRAALPGGLRVLRRLSRHRSRRRLAVCARWLDGLCGWNAMGEIAGYAGDAVGEMADYAAMPRVRWRMRRCTVACGAASQRRTRAAISKSMPAR